MIKDWIIHEFLKKNNLKYIIGIITLITSSILSITIPKLLGYITDLLENRSVNQTGIFQLTMLMLVISIVIFGLKYTWRYFIMGGARDLECFLREKLFSHLQTLPAKFYNSRKTGDLMAYAINDLNAVRQAFSSGLVFFVDGVVINFAALFVMIKTINPLLTLVTLAPISAAIVVIFKLGRPIRKRFTIVQEAFSGLSEKTQENISGIRVVKAFVQEENEIVKLENASLSRLKAQMEYIKLSAALSPAVQVCFGVSFTLALFIGSRFVLQGIMTLGDFIAFNTYLTMLTIPVTHIGKIVEVWQKSSASIKRLNDIFIVESDIKDEGQDLCNNRFNGSIKIRNLSFAYPGTSRKAIKNINVDIEAGKTLGILGKTGSGKTTMINLVLRLYNVGRGHIFIDGKDINDIPVSTLRENIGCVPQDNFLFSASIRDNIELFKKAYSEEEIEEAAKMSSVYDNIIEFPDGFDTVVGERGVTLSGGQKQRISIARAIIKDPSILILDDSLSAVDTKTEEEILTNIKTILNGRTGIIISHRVSTVKHADEVIVIDNGKIIERGIHQELLDLKGEYYKLYCAQMAESKLEQEEVAVV